MNNLILRSISGSIFVILVAGSMVLGEWTYAILFLTIAILGVFEFFKLLKENGSQPQVITGLIITSALFSISFLYKFGLISNIWFYLLLPILVFVFVYELYRKKENPFSNIAYTFFGALYIGLPIALFNGFVFPDSTSNIYQYNIIVSYFALIWIYDSAAYIFGVSFGKHRLFERISPKKSWEGLIGGSVVTLLCGWLLTLIFTDFNIIDWLIIPVLVIVGGTFGDLSESMFKRSINTKDSGNLIPGHGGILDRFDAVFLSSPLVFTYLQLF